MAPHEEDTYHPKDAVRAAITGSMITGGAGLSVAAVQNTLSKKNLKWTGVFTRGGGTIATFSELPYYPGMYGSRLTWCSGDGWCVRVYQAGIRKPPRKGRQLEQCNRRISGWQHHGSTRCVITTFPK